MNNGFEQAVPVTAEPAPLEVREVVHQLSRRFPNGQIRTVPPGGGLMRIHYWLVNVWVQDVLVASERVYPGFVAACNQERDGVTDSVETDDEAHAWAAVRRDRDEDILRRYDIDEPRIDSQWDDDGLGL